MRVPYIHYLSVLLLMIVSMMISGCTNSKDGAQIQSDMMGFWEASNSQTDYVLFYEINAENMTVWTDQLDGFLSLNYQVRSDSLFLNIANPSAVKTNYSFSGIIDFDGPSSFKVENMDQTLSFQSASFDRFKAKTGENWEPKQQ